MSDSKPNGAITSFEAIQELCSKPFPIRFKLHGQECQLSVRYLTPIEAELRRTQLEQAMPPLRQNKAGIESPDWTDQAYLAKNRIIEKDVRAQVIFWCCPEIQNRKPELVDAKYSPANRQAITEFINGLSLSDDVLGTLYVAICEAPVRVSDAVNFGSPAG